MLSIKTRAATGFIDQELTDAQAVEEIKQTFVRLAELYRDYQTRKQATPNSIEALQNVSGLATRVESKLTPWNQTWYETNVQRYFVRPSDPLWIWLERLIASGRPDDAVHFYAGLVGEATQLLSQDARVLHTFAEYHADRQQSGQPQQILEATVHELQGRVMTVRAELESEAKAAKDRSDEHFHLLDEQKRAWSTQFEKWRDDAKAEYAALVKTYESLIPNSKASRYWDDREKEHAKARIGWGIVSTVYFVVAAAIVVALAFLAASHVIAHPNELHLWLIGWTILGIGLLFWPLRIFVRSYLSAYHLMLDASHRKLLIRTYLAMIKHGHAIPESQRTYFLESIFRPATDGIVRDDAAPMSTLEHVLKNIKSPG